MREYTAEDLKRMSFKEIQEALKELKNGGIIKKCCISYLTPEGIVISGLTFPKIMCPHINALPAPGQYCDVKITKKFDMGHYAGTIIKVYDEYISETANKPVQKQDAYKQAEREGRAFISPYKVKDELWAVIPPCKDPIKVIVRRIVFLSPDNYYFIVGDKDETCEIPLREKDLFLSEEESRLYAEKYSLNTDGK